MAGFIVKQVLVKNHLELLRSDKHHFETSEVSRALHAGHCVQVQSAQSTKTYYISFQGLSSGRS